MDHHNNLTTEEEEARINNHHHLSQHQHQHQQPMMVWYIEKIFNTKLVNTDCDLTPLPF
jgi:hypothetical protein